MAPLNLTGVQQNPTYETSDGNINIRIEYDACATGDDTSSNCSAGPPTPDWQTATFPYMDADGNPTPSDFITEYFGTDYDAVLAQQQALDATGTPVVSQSVAVQAVSQDGTQTTPIGSGTTDDNGYVTAPVGTTGLQGDSTYQDPDNLNITCPFSRRTHRTVSSSRSSAQDETSDQLYSDPNGTV